MQTTNQTSKNIIICGDAGVGKTTLLTRYTTGEFTKLYKATIKLEMHNVNFCTNIGNVKFEIRDLPGQDILQDQKEIKEKVDRAIIMFDLGSRERYRSVRKWYNRLIIQFGDIPRISGSIKTKI